MSTDGFAGRLKRERLARGLSQAQLAGEGVSPSYVSLLEAGRRSPTADVVAHLAARLGCTPELLVHGVEGRDRREVELDLSYAELALRSGEHAEAERRLRGLLSDPLVVAVPELTRRTTWLLAQALEAVGHLEQAIASYEQLVPGPEGEVDDGWLPVVIALCRCYREVGDLTHSVELGERATARARSLGMAGTDEEVELAATLVAAYHERGDVTRARVLAGQVVARAEQAGTRRARGAAYWNASLVASSAGRTEEAVQLAERALALYAEGASERALARLRSAYAWLLLRLPSPEARPALAQLEQASAALAEDGTAVDLAYCDTEAARALLALGDVGQAQVRARAALQRLGPQTRLERAAALVVLARACREAGDVDASLAALSEAASGLATVESSREAAAVWCELAELCAALGDHTGALDAYRHATGFLGAPTAVRLPTHA